MKPLTALLLMVLATGCTLADPGPRVAKCPLDEAVAACPLVPLGSVRLEGAGARLVQPIEVPPDAFPPARPLMVHVIALASSEVSWNGIVIGRNGVPAADAAREVPGHFLASFVVPQRLVRPGRNLLSVRMSAHRLFLPVRRPVHVIEVAPYETPSLPGLSDYLPALLTLGALAAAFAYFGLAAWGESKDEAARLPALVAFAAMLQLGAEVSRTFVAYTYPWHLARVTAIALLAAALAILIAAYAARRFVPARRRGMIAATAVAAAASVILFPWYDIKALGAIFAGGLALGGCGWLGRRGQVPRAGAALLAAIVLVALLIWQGPLFLDRGWYLFLATLLVALVAEQVATLRRTRAERDAETRRASALAERLARAEREGEPIVAIRDGGRIHRVAESDIVAIRAADDYCDVTLRDGRNLLTTLSLARFLATLPARFVRVHKSHAVNRAHVTTIAPKPGGGRLLMMSDGSAVPVGRSYEASVAAAIAVSPARVA